MEKPQQVLIIEPSSELRFQGPFTNPVTSFLRLTNPIDKKVCFKIKTTAPKKYCVRPNSGILEPNKSLNIAGYVEKTKVRVKQSYRTHSSAALSAATFITDIAGLKIDGGINILSRNTLTFVDKMAEIYVNNCSFIVAKAVQFLSLQPFDFDPNEKNKHKFMVLTMIAPEGVSYENMWHDVKPECLMDSKLKCVFEMPVENNETAGDGAMDDTLTVQEKLKKMEVKPSSKSATEFSPDVAKVSSDIKNLRMEESNLRQENVELKEEIMRLRRLAQNESEKSSTMGLQEHNPSLNRMYIVLAAVMGVFGFLLGKFFF